MTEIQQKIAAKDFVERWKDRGYEKGESQPFWLSLLRDVYGVEHPEDFIEFEDQVKLEHTSFMDGYIPSTKVLVEQKDCKIDLSKEYQQADGTKKTPFEQARRYAGNLAHNRNPRWIVVCNFQKFEIHDMNDPDGDPEVVLLENLEKDSYRLNFLVGTIGETHIRREEDISVQAGSLVGLLYDSFIKQYPEPDSSETLHSLNVLCVRLVFCLYAEDGGIFPKHLQFHDYMATFETRKMRKALEDLFKILDTPVEERDIFLEDDDPDLAAFPYVNGGLFSEENIIIPPFTEEIREILLEKASAGFNWSEISPTIFGAVFESTLNQETRRSGGMHYTSVENIHKVIDPLFLDELEAEFRNAMGKSIAGGARTKALHEFQGKLSSLSFLDPACGSGNFLTETYLSLRRLENQVIANLTKETLGQIGMFAYTIGIQVSIQQFYGIEINDFAVSVAKTALWIAESQMMKETEEIIGVQLDFLPLKNYANIKQGNALLLNWKTLIPKNIDYIMGNPPFVGYKFQSRTQKEEIKTIAGKFDNYGTLDYVSGWYIKASDYMKNNTYCRCAFVSTNSVSQGEHVNTLWKPLFASGVEIIFAYRTFKWDSEANVKAHVHCVIIGFSRRGDLVEKKLWDEYGQVSIAEHINGYLLDAPNIFVDKRSKPWNPDTPVATKGNAAMDNGFLTITADEKKEIIAREPELETVIRRHMSAEDFINGKENYCFWLKGVSPQFISKSKELQKRVHVVRDYRKNSKRAATKRMADYPSLFAEIRQPDTNYIMIPVISSEKRKYVPIAFLSPDIINSYASISIPEATLYHFGVLCSIVHNEWMRALCGRLEMRYRYSTTIVYNNFPWPSPSDDQKNKIEQNAQAILDARALYPDSSLAYLYDDVTMPPELRDAHHSNDKAVMAAYGWTSKDEAFSSESACVAELMKLYNRLCDG